MFNVYIQSKLFVNMLVRSGQVRSGQVRVFNVHIQSKLCEYASIICLKCIVFQRVVLCEKSPLLHTR